MPNCDYTKQLTFGEMVARMAVRRLSELFQCCGKKGEKYQMAGICSSTRELKKRLRPVGAANGWPVTGCCRASMAYFLSSDLTESYADAQ